MTWISLAGWGYPIELGRAVDLKKRMGAFLNGGFNALLQAAGLRANVI
jgi:hypothetical protein